MTTPRAVASRTTKVARSALVTPTATPGGVRGTCPCAAGDGLERRLLQILLYATMSPYIPRIGSAVHATQYATLLLHLQLGTASLRRYLQLPRSYG
eukprot:scaffold5707_cov188-Prasinococcus_capsulatus_cf.AAC.1